MKDIARDLGVSIVSVSKAIRNHSDISEKTRERRPDGVFCFNDAIAIGAMRAAWENGLRVPEDIAFVGCGNIPHSAVLRVPLTTIEQDSAGIGENAATLAQGLIESGSERREPNAVLLRPTPVVRESTRRKPQMGEVAA